MRFNSMVGFDITISLILFISSVFVSGIFFVSVPILDFLLLLIVYFFIGYKN